MIQTGIRLGKKVTDEQICRHIVDLARSFNFRLEDCSEKEIDIEDGKKRLQKISFDDATAVKLTIGRDSLCCIWKGRELFVELTETADKIKWLSWLQNIAAEDANLFLNDRLEEYNERMSRILTNIMKGAVPYLPVVIITTKDWMFPLDPYKAARDLFCIAHVIAVYSKEDSRKVSKMLKTEPGAVSVLLPGKHTLSYIPEAMPETDICEEIIKAIQIQRDIPPLSTWEEVLERKLKEKTEIKEENIQPDHDTLLEIADKTAEEWKEKYLESEKQCRSLSAQLNNLKQSNLANGTEILKRGGEKDYYKDEVLETVIHAVENEVKTSRGRKKDILEDILKNNPIENNGEKTKDELAKIFRDNTRPNERMLNALKRLGFDCSSEGKHFKIVWHGDGRYWEPLSKTPSDRYMGETAFGKISNKIF